MRDTNDSRPAPRDETSAAWIERDRWMRGGAAWIERYRRERGEAA